MFSRKGSSKLDFRIKLLSGNNVVLIEANGYESEIFIPEVFNGRLNFQNIVPNRRCCNLANNSQSKVNKKRLQSALPNSNSTVCMRKPLAPINSHTWRMSAGQESRVSPLAYSTPNSATITSINRSAATTTTKRRIKENVHNSFEHRYSKNNIAQSPEPARSSVPTPYEILKDTLVQIPNGIKVIRLYRDPKAGAPKKVGRVIGMSSEQVDCSEPHKSVCSNSDFQLPDTPNLTLRPNIKNQKTLVQTSILQAHQKQILTPGSVTKWRKCLTPRRTYSRRAIALVQGQSSGSSVKKRPSKLQPDYMCNATQGTRPTNKIEVRKRKLIVDTKKTISPTSFKKQQRNSIEDLNLVDSHQLPKTRKHFEMSKSSAFDMLTSSNRAPNLSPKLSEQFRKGCLNKASSTYPKYKLLCSMPPLEHDEQMHALRRQNQDKKNLEMDDREKRQMQFLSNVTAAAIAEKAAMQAIQRNVGISITPTVKFQPMQQQQTSPRIGRRAT